MASALYDTGRNAFLNADVDWLVDDIRLILIDTANYTVNLATDDFLNDIPVPARVTVAVSLVGKTSTAGIADSADVVFTAVTGASVEALVLYRHTGVESTSQLIAYIDTATGLPVTPNGGDITVVWSNATNKIFKL